MRYCKSTIFQANHNRAAAITNNSGVVCDTAKVRFFKQITTISARRARGIRLFAILQKYDFSSKSQRTSVRYFSQSCCLRYCKSTIFQANHNYTFACPATLKVVCDTAKVRFFKQITTYCYYRSNRAQLFAILQKYDFSSKSQHECRDCGCKFCCLRYCKSTIFQANHNFGSKYTNAPIVVCDTAKVRFFKQITTPKCRLMTSLALFAILQKYDFSSKSQLGTKYTEWLDSCLRYCKSTIFQANHNASVKVWRNSLLFAILQKYDFSSKSQLRSVAPFCNFCCLRYCKSTIFQANHNPSTQRQVCLKVVCDTAKVRFFKQITTHSVVSLMKLMLFAILQKYDFSSKSQQMIEQAKTRNSCLRYCKSTIFQANHNTSYGRQTNELVVCDTAKVRFFKQITTRMRDLQRSYALFAILQKYDFSSKSQLPIYEDLGRKCCLRYCKSTIFQANHNQSCR